MIRGAATCDLTGCMALYLERDANADIQDGLEAAGWIFRSPDPQTPNELRHVCPACAAGRGPVVELGQCPTCTGRTVDLPDGATCQYCQTAAPYPTDLDGAVWHGRGVLNTANDPEAVGDDWF
jgi:hypothetical protein